MPTRINYHTITGPLIGSTTGTVVTTRWVSWSWLCPACDQASFATFPSEAEAEEAFARHTDGRCHPKRRPAATWARVAFPKHAETLPIMAVALRCDIRGCAGVASVRLLERANTNGHSVMPGTGAEVVDLCDRHAGLAR